MGPSSRSPCHEDQDDNNNPSNRNKNSPLVDSNAPSTRRNLQTSILPTTKWILITVVVFSSLASQASAEFRPFSAMLEPTSEMIHYSDGYIIAPGFVDLGGLLFTTADDGTANSASTNDDDEDGEGGGDGDDEGQTDDDTGTDDPGDTDDYTGTDDPGETDDYTGTEDPNDDYTEGDGDDDGVRRQLKITDTVIDVVVFHEPANCSKSREGCSWPSLGVGATDSTGNLRWCCWGDAVDLGFCKGYDSDVGRLLLNETLFQGEHRSVTISATGTHEVRVSHPMVEVSNITGGTGSYVLVMANCNEEGRRIQVEGLYKWKSVHGYLPGELFTELYFYSALVVVYLVLAIWYGGSMWWFKEHAIPIQKWVLVTIVMGLMETFFKAGDLWVWNEDGTRFWFAMYVGVGLGVLKRAISRCLVLMVSLGWGVIRDTLDDQLPKILSLGILYIAISIARDVLAVVAVVDLQTISTQKEEELIDTVTILTLVIAVVNVTFYLWILDALNGTMQYLENMNQSRKLLRYLRLRLVLLLSILFAICWAVFVIVDKNMESGMLERDAEWVINGAWEVNYILILAAVAVLWRPNDAAKHYAFVMELPSMGGDVEFDTNDGVEELEEDVVDLQGRDVGVVAGEQNGNGSAEYDEEKFKIDDAVKA